MKKLFALALLGTVSLFAAGPNPQNLMKDSQDPTDIFAIPLDESDVDDQQQLKEMHAEQAEYFKKNPEAYKQWLKNNPKR